MIKFIIDSTIDLTDDYIAKNNVDMISLQVIIDDRTYRDRTEITITELYKAIRNESKVQTSLPIYSDMHDLFEYYAKRNQDFIFYTFSAALSGTFQAATMIVEEMKELYPNVNMKVINSKNGGTPGAIMAMDIIDKIHTGASFNDVLTYAEYLGNKMENLFLVNDLTQLKRGGRISTLKSLVGTILSIKPILILNQGKIEQFKSSIGLKRAINDMIDHVTKSNISKDSVIGINYSENEELLYAVEKKLSSLGYNNILKSRIASVMTAHIGLDAVSISFYKN